jgi:two-component system CheB/CheR fusion protein
MASKRKSAASRPKEERRTSPAPPPPKAKAAGEHAEGEDRSCPIVGVGASAGGLEAITEILRYLGDEPGMAIVFIQHLDPKHASMLTELLARATGMHVQQVTDSVMIEANHVYVIAPNTCIGVRKGFLFIEPRQPATPHMPIDHFFRSLAEDQGGKAIGVVLSGTASDGTLGLKAIKEAGGITFAQDPESAKYDGMPRSAIVAGCVDQILSSEAIAQELIRLCQHPYVNRPRPPEEVPLNEKGFDDILNILRTAKGVDFNHYKPGTVRRRVMRRMAIHRLETPAQYAAYLKNKRDEVDLLFNDILINVTSFFREPATFTALTTHVLPALIKKRSHEDAVRVWVPGCATGEEAYSVAICVLEYMRQTGVEIAVQLFGTDLSDGALEQARAGIYPQSIEADVSPERLRRFFVATNGTYQIARSVRDMCIFARQNVTKDPPFSKLDLITCRNVLIYLDATLQGKVMRLFHYALKPSGFLVLGASETIGNASDLFGPVDRQHKIYTRKPTPATIVNDFSSYEEPFPHEAVRKPVSVVGNMDDPGNKVDQLLLARYSPPGVLVDSELRVLQFRGDTSAYLRHPPGSATLKLTKLARGSLAAEVRKLMQYPEVRTSGLKSKPVSVSLDGAERKIAISILPVQAAPQPQYLIVFEHAIAPERRTAKAPLPGKSTTLTARLAELEDELAGTKRYLHAVIEEQEAASEELKSAHEEVQSSNEELQSTNEELLTAKEELQSTNEELTTVNDEMQSRNAELQQINNDLLNLLSSVNIPIVMLGNDLRIRRYTPHAEKILNLLPTDIGRPVSDFRLKIALPDLAALCHEVIDSLVPKEREVQDSEGRLYSMWLRPYRTADNRIDGVVLALFDVTERKEAAELRYRRLFEMSRHGIVIADATTGEILDVNPAITKMLGYQRTGLVGAKFWESGLFRGSEVDESILTDLQNTEHLHRNLMLRPESGEPLAVDIGASLYWEGERKVVQFNIHDASIRRRIEAELELRDHAKQRDQQLDAVGRLAGGVAHDFNNLLTAILGYTDLLNRHLGGDEAAAELLEEVRSGTERAIGVTRQLMAFGRQQSVSPEWLDLNRVIEDTRQILSVMTRDGIDLAFDLQPDLEGVRADRTQVEQILLNLMLNARDAMPDGGTVSIATSNVAADDEFARGHPGVPPGKYVSLTVRDSGAGMDKQTQSRMFEPFFSTKPGGAGLGLSTVADIVRQNDGYISAYSQLGAGTTFSIFLPPADGGGAAREIQAADAAQARGTETILLVEDEHPVRGLARRFLEARGYRVLTASSGPEALRIAREKNLAIDLLVTNVVMPKMSGRELALQLASERPEMPVLYISGHPQDALAPHGVLANGIDLLPKPFTEEALAARVREILDRGKENS